MKHKKTKLAMALNTTNELPDDWFGNESARIEDLPSVKNKKTKVRKNLFIEYETVAYLELQSKKTGVPFTSLANDILTGFVMNAKMPKKER